MRWHRPCDDRFKASENCEESLKTLLSRLESDPNWYGGRYYEHGGVPETMTRIRFETLVHYGIHELLVGDFPDSAAREMEIERMARKWGMEFDANSMVVLERAISLITKLAAGWGGGLNGSEPAVKFVLVAPI